MKLITKNSALLALMIAVLFSACSDKEKYTLEYNLSEGDSFRYTMTTETSSVQSMMGQEMVMDIDMDMKFHYDVTRVEENDFTMQLVFDAMKMSMEISMGAMGSQQITFDSETEATTVTQEDMGPLFKAMTGIPMEIKASKAGKVESLTGYDKLLEAMAASLGEGMDPQMIAQMEQTLSQQMSEEYMKSIYEQMSTYLPGKPVSVGETWKNTMKINSGNMALDAEMSYTLKSVEDNIASLDITGTVKVPEGGLVQEAQGMTVTMNLEGTQSGSMRVDMNTGWPTETELLMDMTGNVEMMGMKVPMTTTAKTLMKQD